MNSIRATCFYDLLALSGLTGPPTFWAYVEACILRIHVVVGTTDRPYVRLLIVSDFSLLWPRLVDQASVRVTKMLCKLGANL